MVDSTSQYGSVDTIKASKSVALLALMLFSCNLGGVAHGVVSHTYTVGNAAISNVADVLSDPEKESIMNVGWILAWMCTSFYLSSRVPQIYKNCKRHSVEGVSVELFVFAVGGNISYALSILTHPGHTWYTLMKSLPYLVGSMGILSLDVIIFGQMIYYKRHPYHSIV